MDDDTNETVETETETFIDQVIQMVRDCHLSQKDDAHKTVRRRISEQAKKGMLNWVVSKTARPQLRTGAPMTLANLCEEMNALRDEGFEIDDRPGQFIVKWRVP